MGRGLLNKLGVVWTGVVVVAALGIGLFVADRVCAKVRGTVWEGGCPDATSEWGSPWGTGQAVCQVAGQCYPGGPAYWHEGYGGVSSGNGGGTYGANYYWYPGEGALEDGTFVDTVFDLYYVESGDSNGKSHCDFWGILYVYKKVSGAWQYVTQGSTHKTDSYTGNPEITIDDYDFDGGEYKFQLTCSVQFDQPVIQTTLSLEVVPTYNCFIAVRT